MIRKMSETPKKQLNMDAIALILDLKICLPLLTPADQELIQKVVGKAFLA